MATTLTTWQKIEGWFAKVFKSLPKWSAIASATLNADAPLFEDIVTAIDPAVAPEVDPIVTAIQVDLGTVSTLLNSGTTLNLTTLLAAIKTNLSALLTEAHITDSASVQKANVLFALVDSIAAKVPTA